MTVLAAISACGDGGGDEHSHAGTSSMADTVAPAAPQAPTLTADTDTGRSQTDRITNCLLPKFSGTGLPSPALVYIYMGGVLWGYNGVNDDGSYTVSRTNLISDGIPVIVLGDNAQVTETFTARVLQGEVWSDDSPATSVLFDGAVVPAPQAPQTFGLAVTGQTEANADFTLWGTNDLIELGKWLVGMAPNLDRWSVKATGLTGGDGTFMVGQSAQSGSAGSGIVAVLLLRHGHGGK
jgi:hypothetical protein